jgi:hypothetical protein
MRQLLAIAVLLVISAPAARADDKAAAEAAFLRGKQLLKDGFLAEACDAFARSEKLDPQLGTQYNLALCYEKLGRTASAWALFRELVQRDRNGARRKDATRRADDLSTRLTRMLINVEGAVAGLAIARNGEDVTATVGIESPVDPGVYQIVASAPGHRALTLQVSARGEGITVAVSIPALEPQVDLEARVDPPAEPTPTAGSAAPPDPPGPPLTDTRPSRGRRRLALIVGGAGAIAAAGGLGLGVVARGTWAEVEMLCGDDRVCPSEDLDRAEALRSQASTQALGATILVGAGAAAIAAGVLLWMTAPDETFVVPTFDDDGAVVALRGSF